MLKDIRQIEVAAIPAGTERCFDILRETGARSLGDVAFTAFALFGGAPRDADYAAHYNDGRQVNDYDLRVWLPGERHGDHVADFVRHLGIVAARPIKEVPSAGTGRIRYYIDDLDGIEMDVSIRPGVADNTTHVARSRAGDANIGLSSIAVAPDLSVWAPREYTADRDGRTLSVYPPHDTNQSIEYTERMRGKFPDHTVVYLGA